jgi:pSer/pThr/pTyr-binding forkhead associated (FHA) protein
MQVALVMFKDGQRRDFPLSAPRTVLGRREDCDLRIPTKDVSRQHCAILLNGEKIVVKDLGSSNGTYVNGKRVAEYALQAGDRLHLGPVTFLVQINGKPARVRPEDLAPPSTVQPEQATKPGPAAAAGAGAAVGAAAAGGPSEEETFELSEEDFDIDDAMAALEDDEDEDDMP